MSHFADDETLTHITALELEVVRLREALTDITDVFSTIGITAGIYDDELDALEKAAKTLSTPFTPTALNELIEKVEKRTIERCAVEANKSWCKEPCYICTISADIRALPTGKIKLEELL